MARETHKYTTDNNIYAPDVRRIIKWWRNFQELLKLVQHIHGIGLELIAVDYVQIVVVEIVQPTFNVQCVFSRVQASEKCVERALT